MVFVVIMDGDDGGEGDDGNTVKMEVMLGAGAGR